MFSTKLVIENQNLSEPKINLKQSFSYCESDKKRGLFFLIVKFIDVFLFSPAKAGGNLDFVNED